MQEMHWVHTQLPAGPFLVQLDRRSVERVKDALNSNDTLNACRRPVPKEYLHSAELRDIMQFGSSSTAVFFKMRVAGVLHIFQFETRQGEDICMALQTHINDIMMKRYSKVRLSP